MSPLAHFSTLFSNITVQHTHRTFHFLTAMIFTNQLNKTLRFSAAHQTFHLQNDVIRITRLINCYQNYVHLIWIKLNTLSAPVSCNFWTATICNILLEPLTKIVIYDLPSYSKSIKCFQIHEKYRHRRFIFFLKGWGVRQLFLAARLALILSF